METNQITNKNDQTILELKNKIEEKKKQLETSNRFQPITNCSVPIHGLQKNIHTMNVNDINFAIAYLNSLQMGLKQIMPDENLVINGFHANDWITDLKNKHFHLNITQEKEKLKKMEENLHNLLSNETKISIELENIKNQLDG